MSPYSDTLSSFRANECVLSGETTIITNCIVFGLTRSGLKPTIYHPQGKNTSNHTTDAVRRYRNRTNAKNEFLYCADNMNLDLSRKQCKVSISTLHLSTYQCVDVLRYLKVNLFFSVCGADRTLNTIFYIYDWRRLVLPYFIINVLREEFQIILVLRE